MQPTPPRPPSLNAPPPVWGVLCGILFTLALARRGDIFSAIFLANYPSRFSNGPQTAERRRGPLLRRSSSLVFRRPPSNDPRPPPNRPSTTSSSPPSETSPGALVLVPSIVNYIHMYVCIYFAYVYMYIVYIYTYIFLYIKEHENSACSRKRHEIFKRPGFGFTAFQSFYLHPNFLSVFFSALGFVPYILSC